MEIGFTNATSKAPAGQGAVPRVRRALRLNRPLQQVRKLLHPVASGCILALAVLYRADRFCETSAKLRARPLLSKKIERLARAAVEPTEATRHG